LPLLPGYNDPNAPAKGVPRVYLLKEGTLQVLTKDISRPNGLAFSPDEKYLYINNSFQMTILRFDVLPDDTIANGRLFLDENADNKKPFPGCASPDVCPGDGYPDGMKVDRKGNVYCTGPGGIWIVSAEGKHLGTIRVPGRPANLGFGGADGATLFITSRPGLYRIRLQTAGKLP
jgi:gluconolactonase